MAHFEKSPYEIPQNMTNAPAKRSQHFNATTRFFATYIVGHNMLRAFGHPEATCCEVLRYVGPSCWLRFDTGQIFRASFVDVA